MKKSAIAFVTAVLAGLATAATSVIAFVKTEEEIEKRSEDMLRKQADRVKEYEDILDKPDEECSKEDLSKFYELDETLYAPVSGSEMLKIYGKNLLKYSAIPAGIGVVAATAGIIFLSGEHSAVKALDIPIPDGGKKCVIEAAGTNNSIDILRAEFIPVKNGDDGAILAIADENGKYIKSLYCSDATVDMKDFENLDFTHAHVHGADVNLMANDFDLGRTVSVAAITTKDWTTF